MGTFNPEDYLNDAIEGANSTVFAPIPDGEFIAVIGSDDKSVAFRENTKNPHQCFLDVTWEIQDEALASEIGRKPTVRQSLFIELDSNNRIDRGKGKNVALGRLREALRQNDPSTPWTPASLKGAGPAKIRVTQRADKDDDSKIYNDVKAVTAA